MQSKLSAKWGLLSCAILIIDRQSFLNCISKLGEIIDKLTPIEAIKNRALLLRTSLFLLLTPLRSQASADYLFEFFTSQKNLACISLNSPDLLRYVVTLAFMTGKESGVVKHVKLEFNYSDILFDAFKTLYMQYNIAKATAMIDNVADFVGGDLFLRDVSGQVIDGYKKSILNMMARTYKNINETLAAQVGYDVKTAGMQRHVKDDVLVTLTDILNNTPETA